MIDDETRPVGTEGAVVSGATTFETLTVTEDALVLPEVSRAVAEIVWVPFDVRVEFQVPEYGATVRGTPRSFPSSFH